MTDLIKPRCAPWNYNLTRKTTHFIPFWKRIEDTGWHEHKLGNVARVYQLHWLLKDADCVCFFVGKHEYLPPKLVKLGLNLEAPFRGGATRAIGVCITPVITHSRLPVWHNHWYLSHSDNKHLTYRVQIGHIEEELRKGVRNSNVVDCGQRKTTLERSNCKPRSSVALPVSSFRGQQRAAEARVAAD